MFSVLSIMSRFAPYLPVDWDMSHRSRPGAARRRTRSTVSTMADRDVERDCTPKSFVDTLRRLADAIEAGESFRIQVAGTRFTIPAGASLSIEHEAEGGEEELEFQLRWQTR